MMGEAPRGEVCHLSRHGLNLGGVLFFLVPGHVAGGRVLQGGVDHRTSFVGCAGSPVKPWQAGNVGMRHVALVLGDVVIVGPE